jgi:hypothetical protein
MIRVDENNKCPICKKPDWCLIDPSGKAVICARKESDRRCGEAGWLHILDKTFIPAKPRKKKPANINWGALAQLYDSKLNNEHKSLAKSTHVSVDVWNRFDIGWDGIALTFPMKNEQMQVVGIQRRFADTGNKRLVKGSTDGLFIPNWINFGADWVFVCEGVTDAATATQLGFEAIGRYNCSSGLEKITKLFRRFTKPNITIISDNDDVGIRGALQLNQRLVDNGRLVKLILPPNGYNDLNDWYKNEGEKVAEIIKNNLAVG